VVLETLEMSDPLPAEASTVDWTLVASAIGVFVATMVTTVWGWMQGRKKSSKTADESNSEPFHVAGAVLQDNTSLRDNTHAVKELRDQVLLLSHILERHVRIQDNLSNDIDDLMKRLDKVN